MGNLLDWVVVSANSYNGTTAAKYWSSMYNNNELLQNIKLVFADGTFGGTLAWMDNLDYASSNPLQQIFQRNALKIMTVKLKTQCFHHNYKY
ncbi:MAG: hypothetical protein LBT43_09890 [Prevotella sp.]|jgi:hypothetical protein|nr:hypothetical protein [Prevotella sp.]